MATNPLEPSSTRPSEQHDAEPLPYAPAGVVRRSNRRKLRRNLLIVAGCLGGLAFIELAVDYRDGKDYCPVCGALARVRTLRILGVGGELTRTAEPGPISQFIQVQTGQGCSHQWRFMHRTGGGLLTRYRADGSHPCSMQWWFEQSPGAQALLKQEAARDPGSLARLRAAVSANDDPTRDFWMDLVNRVYGGPPLAPASQPATLPSIRAPLIRTK